MKRFKRLVSILAVISLCCMGSSVYALNSAEFQIDKMDQQSAVIDLQKNLTPENLTPEQKKIKDNKAGTVVTSAASDSIVPHKKGRNSVSIITPNVTNGVWYAYLSVGIVNNPFPQYDNVWSEAESWAPGMTLDYIMAETYLSVNGGDLYYGGDEETNYNRVWGRANTWDYLIALNAESWSHHAFSKTGYVSWYPDLEAAT